MKRISAVLVVLLASSAVLPARADDASKRAKVVELFQVLHVNRLTEQITSSVRNQMQASMRTLPGGGQMTPAQKKIVDDYQNKVMALVNQDMSWKVLEPQMIALYTSTYSEQEIEGILSFYKSPTGQAMLAKTPELTEKSMAISQGKLMALQPKISALSQDFARQFAAAQAPPAKTGTPGAAAPKR